MMIPTSYLIAIASKSLTTEYINEVFEIAGTGKAISGVSNDDVQTDLWIIPKGRRNSEEVTKQLQALQNIQAIHIVALGNPVETSDLPAVRQLFADIGLNAAAVPDASLLTFLNTKLNGQHSFYIDFDPLAPTPNSISIKSIQEHPQFSLPWIKEIEPGKGTQHNSLSPIEKEITTVIVEEVVSVEELEPPPPPPAK